MKTLLLEIGVEEIPARFIEPAKEGLVRNLQESLNVARLPFNDTKLPRIIILINHDKWSFQLGRN